MTIGLAAVAVIGFKITAITATTATDPPVFPVSWGMSEFYLPP